MPFHSLGCASLISVFSVMLPYINKDTWTEGIPNPYLNLAGKKGKFFCKTKFRCAAERRKEELTNAEDVVIE